MVQSLWEQLSGCLKTQNMQLPHELASAPLAFTPIEIKTMFTQNPNINVHRSFTHNGQKLHTNCGCALRHVSRRVWLFATPWTVVHQAPLSVGVSRQEYWRGLPCPPPGDLPDPGIEPTFLMSPALAVTRTWYNLHKSNLHWVPESDAACIFWPRSSHLSFRHFISSLSLLFFLNMNAPAALLQSSFVLHAKSRIISSQDS